jgi:hypothetical protein
VGTLPPGMAGFVCIYYGNTGSSWLLDALDASPDVWVPGFEPTEGWAWDTTADEHLEWLETVLSPPTERSGPNFEAWLNQLRKSPQVTDGPDDAGFTLTGLKMNDLAANETEAVVDIVGRTGSKVIHLVRENRLKHALSLYRYHDEDKSQFHGMDEYEPTQIEFKRFAGWLKESERLHDLGVKIGELCDQRLDKDRVFHLSYEEFTDDEGKDLALKRLATFLDISHRSFSDGRYSKATPDSLSTAIANYRPFRLRYRLTEHAQHLD